MSKKPSPITFGTLVRNIIRNKAGYVMEVGRGYAIVKYADGTSAPVKKEHLEVMPNAD